VHHGSGFAAPEYKVAARLFVHKERAPLEYVVPTTPQKCVPARRHIAIAVEAEESLQRDQTKEMTPKKRKWSMEHPVK
jgi:hypothetical protein